ncbi:sporulation protein YtrH [Scopulibacillus darangshiensis]|uniref:Sporulation protein YtrH n=1 Tax=Scopulibacillus darangshiensis TaxID=442528 RepID=A0A4R2PAI5_9BACL|nr:YtrH family sporulation protein [Scopulibacillus darangshiensis]TCP32083.1 sporulation protein YtrH [Scopulibacillus darangshiensis]
MDFRMFASTAIMNFFIAFGVIIGGCFIGGIGAFLVSRPPLSEMNNLADSMKIWAVVTAIGGTFDVIDRLEKGFLDGTPIEVVKHLLLIVSAMSGAHTAAMIIHWFTQES